MDSADMRRTLGRMAHEILEENSGAQNLVVVGILRRGWPIAKRLAFLMTQIEGTTVPCAKLDVRAKRDDQKGSTSTETGNAEDSSEIPFAVQGKRVILVDEVIYTGRTIRAALDALMIYGRPSQVQLAVLVDRGHRELPIMPNFCGKVIKTNRGDHVKVLVNEYDDTDAVILEREQVSV